jgi:methyl-accepting chemotaxis protein
MDQIVTSINSVTSIIQAISTASQKQARDIEQVNQTIRQMDKVTLENAALVDQAAGELQGQADTLAQTAKLFKLSAVRTDVAQPLFEKNTGSERNNTRVTSRRTSVFFSGGHTVNRLEPGERQVPHRTA